MNVPSHFGIDGSSGPSSRAFSTVGEGPNRGGSQNSQWGAQSPRPEPKTSDGHPNHSGIWRNSQPPGPPPLDTASPPDPNAPPTALHQFRDIGIVLKGGLPLQPWAAEAKSVVWQLTLWTTPTPNCLPMGSMQFNTHPQPRETVRTPELIVILYEGNAGIGQILLDGRPCPTTPPTHGGMAIRQESGRRAVW
jgi:hypothetical protein